MQGHKITVEHRGVQFRGIFRIPTAQLSSRRRPALYAVSEALLGTANLCRSVSRAYGFLNFTKKRVKRW